MEQKQDWQMKLDESIRRVEQAFEKNKGSSGHLIEAILVAAGTEALAQVGDALARKKEERWERRRERAEKRRRKRLEEAAAAKPQGFVFAGAAILILVFAVLHPGLWWLLFIAFGFSMASASLLSKAYQRDRLLAAQAKAAAPLASGEPPQPVAKTQLDAQTARVDAVCEKILAEIKTGPQIVREVLHKPEKTLQALRGACHELARREAELRSAITAEDEQRLRSERDALSLRIGAEHDEVARARLGLAFQALEGQLAQRAELATAASRYEAERTRILYTLESLHTQILRARSADASSPEVAGAGLRSSLAQLTEEVDAVAEALEAVSRMDARGSLVSPVQPVSDEPGGGGSRGRERA